MDAEKESFELAKLALIQYFYVWGKGSSDYANLRFDSFKLLINANWSNWNQYTSRQQRTFGLDVTLCYFEVLWVTLRVFLATLQILWATFSYFAVLLTTWQTLGHFDHVRFQKQSKTVLLWEWSSHNRTVLLFLRAMLITEYFVLFLWNLSQNRTLFATFTDFELLIDTWTTFVLWCTFRLRVRCFPLDHHYTSHKFTDFALIVWLADAAHPTDQSVLQMELHVVSFFQSI